MPAPANLVHQTTTGTGTGPFTLAGVNGRNGFADKFGTGAGNTFDVFISNRDVDEKSVNIGYMSDATTLVIVSTSEGTSGTSAVNFSAGTKDVMNDVPAAKQVTTDTTQTLTNKDFSSSTNTYRAASDTVTGVVEIATPAEVSTGTDATRAVSPSGLAGAQIFGSIPQNSQSAAYTLVLADGEKHIFHPAADTTARTWTIPANSSVAYPIGTAITFINQNGAGVITIAITTDTLRLAGLGTTGSRTLAPNGLATAIKVGSTEWIISGMGLT